MEKTIKKIKLIYSGELLLFAVVFLTLGILELLAVIKLSERFQLIFKIITLCGATFIVADFIWVMLSPKRKKKNSIMDKAMLLPIAIYLYVFDIYGFIVQPGYGYYQVGVPIAFMYLACVYTFQAIYHYYKPVPSVLEMIEETKKEMENANKPQEEVDAQPKEEAPIEEANENKEEQ